MKLICITKNRLRKIASRVSRNRIWSAVIVSVATAAIFSVLHGALELLPNSPSPVPVERAEVKGGVWSPSRPLYRCGPSGRCVAPDRVVFDSIANDPAWGNEAYFMGATVLGRPGPPQERLDVKVGDTVLLRALIENDAAINASDSRSLVAHGTRFSISIPTNSSSELPLIGHISAANAAPERINDAVFLHGKERFALEYGWRSTVLRNHIHKILPLSDNVVGDGALVGSDHPDGAFPPGLSNNATVFVLVKVVPPAV